MTHIHKSFTIKTTGTLPVDLDTAKNHLRVVHNDDDDMIGDMLTAGVEEFEQQTGRAFSAITAELRLSQFPDAIFIPRPPLVSVESITYTDSRGYAQTLSESDYQVNTDGSPGCVVPSFAAGSFPVAADRPGSVVVRFTCGIPASCPPRIKNALLLWLDLQYHEQDEATAKRVESRIESILVNRAIRHPGLENLTVTD